MTIPAGSEKLPKQNRIRTKKDFEKIVASRPPEGIRVFSHWFEAKALKMPSEPILRYGFTVGKKFAARAVDRNLVKRILREAARHKSSIFLERINEKNTGLDVCLRLVKRFASEEVPQTRKALKAVLRADADSLLVRLSAKCLNSQEGK